MPIVVLANSKDTTHDVIKRFKKAIGKTDLVQDAKDGKYYQKPSKLRAIKKIEMKRLGRRLRKLKRMKNISPISLERLAARLG